jgi:protein TonB
MGTRGSERSNGAVRMHAGLSSLAHAGSPYDDPMSKVLGLDAKTSTLGAWLGFGSGGTLLIVAGMALAVAVAWWHRVHEVIVSDTSQEIEVEKEPPPPPPPPVAPEPEPEPEAKPAAPPPRAMPKDAPPPPPAPAQAAKVLTQEQKPDEPVDLTGNTIVTGNAEAYAGGFTSGNGTGKQAVTTPPSPTGVPGGTGPVNAPQQAAPKVDRSRAVAIGSTEWNCPFPPEADTAQVDEAYVTLQVDVRADGTISAARVLSDPGNGFGREARRCAMSKRLSPALDVDGNPVASTSKPFRVHFSR